MPSGIVLREKLRLPDATGLARERLEGRLRDGRPSSLDIVVAPAGSGKTTLLSRVAASSTIPTGWYRMTAEDTTEERLALHLAGALRPIAPVNRPACVDDLLRDLDAWRGDSGLLIVDDLHEVLGTSAERALERFVSLRPARIRLIFSSRRMPDINIPRLRLSGGFRELGSDDLRFRSWEVEELFTTVYERPLRPEAAATLTRRTGGWAAGLQMFNLATAERTAAERHQAVADLAGRSKLVRSYLTRNVLAGLSHDRRDFLLRTCTLGRLSGKACDALLDTHGSHRLLEELERDQLFTFADDDGLHFWYHEILQTHLEMALIEQYGQAAARSWYAKSGAVLKSLGEYQAAARAFAKANAWAEVSEIVAQKHCDRLQVDVIGTEMFPPNAWHSDPWLALANARRLVRDGALATALEAYGHAASLYDEPSFRRLCHQESEAVSLWLPSPSRHTVGGPMAHHWSAVLREALRITPDFDALSVQTLRREPRSCLAYGVAAVVAGEIAWARQAFSSILRGESGDTLVLLSAKLAVTALDVLGGGMFSGTVDFSDIAAMADREGLPWVARLCHGLQQLGLARSDDAGWRFDCCADIVAAADRNNDAWGAAVLSIAATYARLRNGADISVAELTEVRQRCRDLEIPVLEQWCELAVACATADAAAVRRVVDTSGLLGVKSLRATAITVLTEATSGGDSASMQKGIELAANGGMRNSAARLDVKESLQPDMRVMCFGGFRIEVADSLLCLDRLRPQARNVLKFLALAPDRDHHREYLEDLLWPGIDHATACHRLQVAVSSVRTAIGDFGVEIRRHGESYCLCLPTGAISDVRDFTNALSLAAAASARGDRDGRMRLREKAMSLYIGDLLPEMAVDAVDAERQRLRATAAAAASALASDYAATDDWEKALTAAQRSVDLDPGQDGPWQLLAQLHEKAGDVSSAEFVRRQHLRVQAELAS
jgi:DNA-binding SARP family transcriptional activator